MTTSYILNVTVKIDSFEAVIYKKTSKKANSKSGGIGVYYLMNKDEYVATIIQLGSIYEPSYRLENVRGLLPVGFLSIDLWIRHRNAASHRKHIKRIIKKVMNGTVDGVIRITHYVSINDTYWVKLADESVCWSDVSPYTNELDEVLSEFAIDGGVPLKDALFAKPSPEVTTGGTFPKCCIKEGSTLKMLKRGLDDTGLECYCESLSYDIYRKLIPDCVKYDIVNYHNKVASSCELFTNEDIGFTSYAGIYGSKDKFEKVIQRYKDIGDFDKFAAMIVADALCVNSDRHLNNHGMLIDNKRQKILGMAPVFDENLAFIPELWEDDFDEILEYADGDSRDSAFEPLLWKADMVMTDSIRKKLKDFLDYELSFKGNDIFTKERVNLMNHIIRGHARRLLSN